VSRCKTCGAKIRWAKVPSSGAKVPLDLDPTPHTGNVRYLPGDRTAVEVLGGPGLEQARGDGEELFTSHFATCPQAAQHRRPVGGRR
jgi:hypothetical protein